MLRVKHIIAALQKCDPEARVWVGKTKKNNRFDVLGANCVVPFDDMGEPQVRIVFDERLVGGEASGMNGQDNG